MILENYSRDKLSNLLKDNDLTTYWLAVNARDENIMSYSTVFKYMRGESDLSSSRFLLLLSLIAKKTQQTLVIAWNKDGEMIIKKNIPLISLMESDIC